MGTKMKYKNYELQNLECDILDLMEVGHLLEKHVDLTACQPHEHAAKKLIDELGTTYIQVAIEVDARRAGIQGLGFKVTEI